MESYSTRKLSPAVTLHQWRDARFKTMKLAVNFILPLREETVASYGILPGVITRATREYPTYQALNRRLSELYGATLSAGARKLGDTQCLVFSAGGIANRYAYDGDDMLRELSGVLLSALFDPLREEDGQFPTEHFRQEQRQLLEMKDAEFNDKIAYAHRRCEELLFAGQSAALDRYGSREQIAGLERETLPDAWRRMLSQARVEIFLLGDCDPAQEELTARFSGVGNPLPLEPVAFAAPREVRRVVDEQPVTQSKLGLGFRLDAPPEDHLLYRLMSAVLGGVPSSKLFQNVREKMGLCYYCSSSFSPGSRALYIESGVETGNLSRAEEEILRQVEDLRSGKLTEEELDSAKLALCNSCRSVGDSLGAVQNWYLGRLYVGTRESMEDACRQLMRYTKEQVIEAADRLRLGVSYSLRGKEAG